MNKKTTALLTFDRALNTPLKNLVTHSFPMHPIPYPLKTSENRKVFWCFQGLQKGYTGYERINKYWNSTENHTLSLLFQIYINFEIRSGEKPKLKSHDRAYPSCFMHAIVARMRLPFFNIFSNFVHFCSNFQIFCPFFAFFFFFFFTLFMKNCTHALTF